MPILFWQLLGLALLLGSVGIGHRLWRGRLGGPPSGPETLAALVLLSTFAGGFWGAFAWWQNHEHAFSWRLPGLGARMLAAAGWSFALASFLALRRPFTGHLRAVLWMLWVYLAPLTGAILILHLDRFDFGRPVTWAFFAVVVVLLGGSSTALRILPRDDGANPVGSAARPGLWLIGGLAGLWGLALFIWAAGPVRAVWPWPGDALTTRLIASMFLSIAAGAVAARHDARLAGTVFWATVAYGVGVSAAGVAHVWHATPDPRGYVMVSLPLSYMLVWGGLGLVAAVSLLRLRRAAKAEPP